MTRTTPERPADIEAQFPELSQNRRTSTRLHPRQGSPTPHESSVAGPFLWPASEPWPMCTAPHSKGTGHLLADVRRERRILDAAWRRDPQNGPSETELETLAGFKAGVHAPNVSDGDPIPLLAVAQLFTRDIQDLAGPEGYDLLQVLWCPFEAHGPDHTIDVVLKWRRSTNVTDTLPGNPEPVVVGRKECVPNTCVLHPERIVEHEYAGLLSEELQESIELWEEELLDAEEDSASVGSYSSYAEYEAAAGGETSERDEVTYQHDLSIPPGWKTGGFASWHLTDPAPVTCSCGTAMRPLLTIHDREWDNGTLSWVPLEDRDTAHTPGANVPTGVYLGRGLMQIFTCPTDPTHPHRLNFQ
ncbi:hypothetical protein GCM10010387_65580 [Streptomyces inusitatus]|uniref:LigA protein n=1 Tax=Streptomyces inusitatus TaxID=68221 RepID=A0A918QPC3_9ACTN|nr:hypothetical protein [Streptomyces inusitatus]GGZ63073.1 hypothetical protein GCM10010387_65580 [Streptomyces inusitatus]